MHNLLSYRGLNIVLVLGAIVGMGFALYLQHYQGLTPCPLCVFQRVGLIAMGIIASIAVGLSFTTMKAKTPLRKLFSALSTLAIGWSVGVAGRHVWLQHLPADQVPSCGPGLDYWLDALPLAEVFRQVLSGSGECATIDWTWLGFSLPEWSLTFFSVLLFINLFVLIKR